MKPTILAIIGKPLAGKDTQADLLVASHPESVKISTGHILRAIAEEGETHRFWPIVGPYLPMLEQGLKLPDAPVLAMLHRVLTEQCADGKKLLVIAGSPRGMTQLAMFDDMAHELGAEFRVMHINATDEETYRRSASRNEGRVDDTPQVHAVRLEEYNNFVIPVVKKLRGEGRLIEIDGMRSIESVQQNIESQLVLHVDPEISLPAMARR